MDKHSLVLICNECFKEEGNCLIIHFVEGGELLIDKKPTFFNLNMQVAIESHYDDEIIVEEFYIPYSNVLYIIKTNVDNLKTIYKYKNQQFRINYDAVEELYYNDE